VSKPGSDAFLNHCTLKLGKDSHHLEHGLAGTRPTPKVAIERLRTWAYALDQTAQAIIMEWGSPRFCCSTASCTSPWSGANGLGGTRVASLSMKSVLVSYILSLAVFIPISGWMVAA
jgi:hypothetical protein